MRSLITLVCAFAWFNVSSQIWTEDFEVSGLGTTYTSPSVFTVDLNSHYNRTNGGNISNISAPYSGKHGTFLWAGENLNVTGAGADGLTNKTITFAPIPVTGQTNLQFRGLFGSGNPNNGWDYSDILYVEYKMDAGPWTKLLQFAANAQVSNAGLFQDTNLNGIGEGVALTPQLAQFVANIPVTGISLQLRIYSKCSAMGEEFAFDYLRLYSTTTAVNGCTNPLATNYNAAATVDNGSCSIAGCTNASALNFNPIATTDNGSCVLTVPNLVINEIHYNPNDFAGFLDAAREFVEIHNNSSTTVNIGGWRISDAIDYTFPTGTTVAANAYFIVAATAATYTGNGYNVYQYTGDLSNTGESIRLFNSNNILVDMVTYAPAGCWPTPADGNGPSLELRNFNLDNNAPENYCTGIANNGTPGQVNSCFSSAILGCTNSAASNYNPTANTDDGSCLIYGCDCPTASNYNAIANVNDGTCVFPVVVLGCTYNTASNYNPAATNDNGTCLFSSGVLGCTYATASNYNSAATVDDGSCIFGAGILGCTYSFASNYNPAATVDNGTCVLPSNTLGCTYANATNYNPAATLDNGSCVFPVLIPGCTYASATNYNALATFDNGSCIFPTGTPGCTYSNATNYNATATVDDGSCLFNLVSSCPADFNGDLSVGVSDLIIFIAAYGTTCP
jgi:hypothetical protein